MKSPSENRSPTHSDWLRIEAVLDRFEEAWQSPHEPRIGDYVLAGPNRTSLLLELVRIDLEYRWKSGRARSMAEYIAEFPELAALADELQVEEIRLREFHGRASRSATSTRDRRSASPDQTQGPRLAASVTDEPSTLGEYEIRQKLGGGAFSTVYRAWDAELRRDVAIKVPHPGLFEDKDGTARLRREASSAARLRHPAIVSLHQVCGDGDKTFLVYQFVHGQTLAQLLRETRPAPEQAAQWVVRLADALAYAHSCGIVHRDVKPANILMDQDGRPLLADFGLALQMDASVKLTQQGDILGTPAYMSPEQAGGHNHQVDARSDVYSLGVVLYEILTGKPPFAGSTASVLQQVIHEEPSSIRRQRDGIPADLETICLKAMAKEPGRRYTTAAEFAEDLRRFVRHEPIQARRTGPLGRLARWCRRKPALAATIGIAIITVSVVAGISVWQVLEERDRFRIERDRAQANLYRALTSDTRAQFIARDTGWWWKAMDNIREAATLDVAARDVEELRDLALEGMGSEYYSMRPAVVSDAHGSGVTALALSPDGLWLASAARDGAIKLWSVADQKLQSTVTGHKGPITSIRFHPKGCFFATTSMDGTLALWELQMPGEPVNRHRLALCSKGIAATAFSPDGAILAVGCASGDLHLLHLNDKDLFAKPVVAGTIHLEQPITCLAFSPSGTTVATGDAGKMIRLWDVSSRNQTLTFGPGQTPTSLSFSPNGDRLGWSETEGFGHGLRDLGIGSIAYFPRTHGNRVNQVLLDGLHTYTAGADGTLLMSAYTSFDRRHDLAVGRVPGTSVNAFVSNPGGKQIIAGYSDGKIRWWQLFHPPERSFVLSQCQSLAFLGGSHRLATDERVYASPHKASDDFTDYKPTVLSLAVHPSGRMLAWSDRRGAVSFWDLVKKAPLETKAASSRAMLLAGDPKGEFLASATAEGLVEVSKWTGERVQTLEPAVGSVLSLCWNSVGRYLVASGERGIHVWDRGSSWQARKLSDARIGTGVVAAGQDLLAVAGGEHTVEIRTLPANKTVNVLRGNGGPVSALRFFGDGKQLAALAQGEGVKLWDAHAGKELGVLEHAKGGLNGTILAIDPKERYLAAGGASSLMIWDLQTRTALGPLLHALYGSACEYLADGSGCLFSTFEGGIRQLSVAELNKALATARGPGKEKTLQGLLSFDSEIVVPGGNSDRVWCVSASPDGRWFAVACHDGTVHVWDAVTLKKHRTLTGHTGLVWSCAFSADSKYLASGAQEVKVWEVATCKEVHNWTGHTRLVRGVAFHPKQPLVASASSDGTVRLWNLETGEPMGILHRFSREILNLAFDPSGDHLAGACGDGDVVVWRMPETMATVSHKEGWLPPRHLLKGHQTGVWAVAFHPAGRYLASSSAPGTIILWDGKTFERIATLKGGTAEIRSLSFSHDGELLAGGAYVHSGIVWNLPLLRRNLKELKLDW